MRKLTWMIAALALPAVALAGHFKYHDVKGEIVSADPKAHTFKMKFDDGTLSTGQAEGAAAKTLGFLKVGDKVTVTCKDNQKGQHLAATAIKVDK
jgi:hypothetical protein